MHLKSVTLKGFKSFAQPTTFAFEPGVTCIVGPNGSGKSNVVDALAWVMGEQGAKTLRGGKMEDVIFAGTATRGPLGRAEVQLTIDNADGALPIEYAEVTISRTLFRNGASEYAINGDVCRLLDVQELLSRLRPRPRDARHRRSGPPRHRAAGLTRGSPGIHRGGRRHPQAPPPQGEDPPQARGDGGEPHPAERPRRRDPPPAEAARAAGRDRPRGGDDRRDRARCEGPAAGRRGRRAARRRSPTTPASEQERHTERMVLQDQSSHPARRASRQLEREQGSEVVDEARRVSFALEQVQERLRGLFTLANQRLALLGDARMTGAASGVTVTQATIDEARAEIRADRGRTRRRPRCRDRGRARGHPRARRARRPRHRHRRPERARLRARHAPHRPARVAPRPRHPPSPPCAAACCASRTRSTPPRPARRGGRGPRRARSRRSRPRDPRPSMPPPTRRRSARSTRRRGRRRGDPRAAARRGARGRRAHGEGDRARQRAGHHERRRRARRRGRRRASAASSATPCRSRRATRRRSPRCSAPLAEGLLVDSREDALATCAHEARDGDIGVVDIVIAEAGRDAPGVPGARRGSCPRATSSPRPDGLLGVLSHVAIADDLDAARRGGPALADAGSADPSRSSRERARCSPSTPCGRDRAGSVRASSSWPSGTPRLERLAEVRVIVDSLREARGDRVRGWRPRGSARRRR